uniref:Putative secreted protein n=1 Tax=Ixodes ricinus TaxID=34613 RepID=A0A6B0UL37_IXORI
MPYHVFDSFYGLSNVVLLLFFLSRELQARNGVRTGCVLVLYTFPLKSNRTQSHVTSSRNNENSLLFELDARNVLRISLVKSEEVYIHSWEESKTQEVVSQKIKRNRFNSLEHRSR